MRQCRNCKATGHNATTCKLPKQHKSCSSSSTDSLFSPPSTPPLLVSSISHLCSDRQLVVIVSRCFLPKFTPIDSLYNTAMLEKIKTLFIILEISASFVCYVFGRFCVFEMSCGVREMSYCVVCETLSFYMVICQLSSSLLNTTKMLDLSARHTITSKWSFL